MGEEFDLSGSEIGTQLGGALKDGGESLILNDDADGIGAGVFESARGIYDAEPAVGGDVNAVFAEVCAEFGGMRGAIVLEELSEAPSSGCETGELDDSDGDSAGVVGVDGVESAF